MRRKCKELRALSTGTAAIEDAVVQHEHAERSVGAARLHSIDDEPQEHVALLSIVHVAHVSKHHHEGLRIVRDRIRGIHLVIRETVIFVQTSRLVDDNKGKNSWSRKAQ